MKTKKKKRSVVRQKENNNCLEKFLESRMFDGLLVSLKIEHVQQKTEKYPEKYSLYLEKNSVKSS